MKNVNDFSSDEFLRGTGETMIEKRKIDLLKVGPQIECDFLIITQEARRGVNKGILGRDFLVKHP